MSPPAPSGYTPACEAARLDLAEAEPGAGSKALKGVGRVLVWPLAERGAERQYLELEGVRERMFSACYQIPAVSRADPRPGQRWPGSRGYTRDAQAFLTVAGRELWIYPHPRANTVWIKPERGPVGSLWPRELWPAAAATFLQPLGCQVTEDRPAPADTWEVAYSCPDGVAVFDLAKAQRRALREGRPIERGN